MLLLLGAAGAVAYRKRILTAGRVLLGYRAISRPTTPALQLPRVLERPLRPLHAALPAKYAGVHRIPAGTSALTQLVQRLAGFERAVGATFTALVQKTLLFATAPLRLAAAVAKAIASTATVSLPKTLSHRAKAASYRLKAVASAIVESDSAAARAAAWQLNGVRSVLAAAGRSLVRKSALVAAGAINLLTGLRKASSYATAKAAYSVKGALVKANHAAQAAVKTMLSATAGITALAVAVPAATTATISLAVLSQAHKTALAVGMVLAAVYSTARSILRKTIASLAAAASWGITAVYGLVRTSNRLAGFALALPKAFAAAAAAPLLALAVVRARAVVTARREIPKLAAVPKLAGTAAIALFALAVAAVEKAINAVVLLSRLALERAARASERAASSASRELSDLQKIVLKREERRTLRQPLGFESREGEEIKLSSLVKEKAKAAEGKHAIDWSTITRRQASEESVPQAEAEKPPATRLLLTRIEKADAKDALELATQMLEQAGRNSPGSRELKQASELLKIAGRALEQRNERQSKAWTSQAARLLEKLV